MKVNIGPYKKKTGNQSIRVSVSAYDTWSLDSTLAPIILAGLKKYKKIAGSKMTWGVLIKDFGCRDKKQSAKEHAKMNQILDDMIYSFESIVKDKVFSGSPQEIKKIQKGLTLFGKYYLQLWW